LLFRVFFLIFQGVSTVSASLSRILGPERQLSDNASQLSENAAREPRRNQSAIRDFRERGGAAPSHAQDTAHSAPGLSLNPYPTQGYDTTER